MADATRTAAENLVTITINGIDHSVRAGQRLITAAEGIGDYIPRFCHHDKLEPVGKCRMCLVEVEGPRGKQLVPSCTMIVNEGMVVDTESVVVKKAQEGVLEFLLINHPLDCSVCDKGGECPLQDQTYAHGPGESRFIETKRTFKKPIPISDVVLLDRERCVLCDRCVRVADDIAGDPLITFNERGNSTQILTFPNEPFSSYFSGNTVQVCPVGALTSVDYRFRARPWDLEKVSSVSLRDTMHSSVEIHTTRGKVVRVYGADNDHVNDGWLSDKDRFSFATLHSEDRVTTPLVRNGDSFDKISWPEAIEMVASRLGAFLGQEVGSIGGANSTNEEAYTLGKFMRSVVGTPHIDAQVGDGLKPHLAAAVTPRALIQDLESVSTVFVWGPDLKETLPVMYLRVRKAVRNGAKLVVIHPASTGLDSIATHVVRYRAGSGQDTLRKLASGEGELAGVAETLASGSVVTLFGRASIAEDPGLAESVAAYARGLDGPGLIPLLGRGNTFGALDMGLAPNLLPGRVSTSDEKGSSSIEDAWGLMPVGAGRDSMGMLAALRSGDMKALVLVGSDPVRDCPDPGLAVEALEAADFVVAFDAFLTDSSRLADLVLPAAVWGEVDGTVTNLEGRVQAVKRALPPRGQAQSIMGALSDIAFAMGADLKAFDVATVTKEISTLAPAYEGVTPDYLTFETDGTGVVVPMDGVAQPLGYIPTDMSVPIVTDRFTLHLAASLYDDGVTTRNAPSISGLVPKAVARLNPKDASLLAVSQDSVVTIADVLELPVAVDSTVVQGSVVVPFNHAATKGLSATAAVAVAAVRSEI
ncbi:MAG: NADH-quinone oxidoreductase subunit NuoG [Actinomycetota bacterium]|nr:NADH-quinone oxidoreductase subunit NuoG [Actinomycetota bacterium]